ncbi:MAG: helix-hairpin-helix domain-containing protein [Myxococcales bacterium]|nr:helix-hairpin-helix domain-containing protein [Myxococcales bacterium]
MARAHDPALRLAIVAVVGILVALAPTLPAALGLRRSPLVRVGARCEHAVEIDGVLRCDQTAPRRVADLCGDTTPTTIRSGDAITTKHLCAATSPARGVDWGRMAPEDLKALALPINVNEASAEELASLPRIGPVLADRLIAARPFASVADLLRVRGIGPKTLAKLQRRARTSW